MNNKLLKFLNEDSNIKEFYSKEKCISEFEQNSIEILNKSFIYIETQIKKIDDKFQIDVMKSKPKYGWMQRYRSDEIVGVLTIDFNKIFDKNFAKKKTIDIFNFIKKQIEKNKNIICELNQDFGMNEVSFIIFLNL